MKCLRFERVASVHAGRRIRRPIFEERSALPIGAACFVGNAVLETLSRVLGVSVQTRVTEPAIPTAPAWGAILREARVFRVRGGFGDAAIVLRSADARALAAAAFGEAIGEQRELSRIEHTVVTRLATALVPALAGLCGVDAESAGESNGCGSAYRTYFEVLLEGGLCARVGIALAQEPRAESRSSLRLEDLGDVPLRLHVSLGTTSVSAAALLALRPGATLPMRGIGGARGTLTLGMRPLARGECGAQAGRYVLKVGAGVGARSQ